MLIKATMSILGVLLLPPPNVLKAQTNGAMPYDPCATETEMPSVCIWGSGYRLCTYFGPQWPCSEGYCWGEESSIPPNSGIPANAVLSDKTIEINGVYQITQNVTFVNCNFKMRPGASILITPTATNAEITFEGCKFFGCGSMWLGITIDASGASFLDFTFDSCWVEDAYIALTLDEGKPFKYAVFNNKFINNYIGIGNRKQTSGSGAMLNAVLAGNLFTSTYSLSSIPGSMQNLPMPFHPLAYAGVNYVKASAMIGVFSPEPNINTTNHFFCLVFGIVADNCSIAANNNDFQDLNSGYGRGIWAIDGSMRAVGCHFRNAGQYCIYADGADLTALRNQFEGVSETGILPVNNLNSEFIFIENNNTFSISNDNWRSGIEIQRSVALSGVHNAIRNNTFNVSGTAQLLSCIEVSGVYSPITDEMHIDSNHINVLSNAGTVHGIDVWFGSSQGVKVRGNVLNYQSTEPFGSFGFYFNSQAGMTSNNEVRNNTVTGASNESMQCCFHSLDLEGAEFCENTVDYSIRGIHFRGQNDVILRENQVNHHDYGIWVEGSDARIGVQHGRGNTWSPDPNDCVTAAAQVSTSSGIIPDPMNSRFLVPELNALPFLPPNNKIFPTPIPPQDWFKFDGNVPLEYCMQDFGGGPVKITPYEHEVATSTSVLTGVPLWDLKRKTYAKLLMYPNLRPSSSSEETWFNSLASSSIASFGQVEQMIVNSLSLSTTDQQAFDNYREAIFQLWEDLDGLDALIDFSDPNNLTGTYFADRAELLEDIAQNAESASALENSRNQQTSQSLQNALTFNTNIISSQTYETARKTLNDIRIRHLLREPMTQTRYQQILNLAQQDAETAGSATDEIVPYVAPCDRHQFKDTDESSERSNETHNVTVATSEMLRIAPNPTNGLTKVSVPEGFVGLMTLMDASGKKIRTLSIEEGENMLGLDLSHQIPGLYWITLSGSNGRIVASSKISVIH